MTVYNLTKSKGIDMMRFFRLSEPMCTGSVAGAVSLKKPHDHDLARL